MKIIFIFLIAIGVAATASTTKTGKCLSACGKPSVDDIVSLIKTNKIDVPTLLTKLGVNSGTGKPVTKKPATKNPASGKFNLSEIKKSLPQRGTFDVALFKKSMLKKQTLRQILDKLAKQTGVIFNLKPIPSWILDTELISASIITKLDKLKQNKVPLRTIYNIIFPLLSGSGSPSKKPATTRKPSGKSTTPKPSTADINRIKKSLPQKGTIDVQQLKKSTTDLKEPTFGKVLDVVLKQSKSKFNTKSIPSSVSNTHLIPDLIKKHLAKLPSKASLPAVYDAIFPLLSSNQPSTTPSLKVTTASSKVTTSPSSKVSTSQPISQPTSAPTPSKKTWKIIVKPLTRRSSINIPKLTTSLSGLENPDFEQLLRLIEQGSGEKLDLQSILKSILSFPMDAESIKDVLSPLDKNSPISDVLKAVWPLVFEDEDPETLTTPSSTTTGSSPSSLLTTSSSSITTSSSSITKTTPLKSKSSIVRDAISKFLKGKKSQSIPKLKTSIEKLQNPTVEKLLKRVSCGAGVKFDGLSIPSSILNTPIATKPTIDALSPLKEQSTAQEILDAILPIVFDDDTSVSLTTTTATSKLPATPAPISSTGSPSNSPFTSAPSAATTASSKNPASSKPATKKPKSKSVWNIISKNVPRKTVNVPELKKSLLGLKKSTVETILKRIAKRNEFKIDWSSIPSKVLKTQVTPETINKVMTPLDAKTLLLDFLEKLVPAIVPSDEEDADEDDDSTLPGKTTVSSKVSVTSAPTPLTTPVAAAKPVTPISPVSPKPDDAWNVIVKSVPKRSTIDVTKLKGLLSGLKTQTFKQILKFFDETAGIKFNLKSVPASVLNIQLDVQLLLNALSQLNGKVSIPDAFNAVWPVITDSWDANSSSSDGAWNVIVKSMPSKSGIVNVSKFRKSISGSDSSTFQQVLEWIGSAGHVKFDMSTIPSKILKSNLKNKSILNAMSSLDKKDASVTEIFDLIWTSMVDDLNTDDLSSQVESYESIVIRLPETRSIDVDELKKSIDDVKNQNFGEVLSAIGSAAGIIFDLKQLPLEISNINVCTATIQKGLNKMKGPASIVQVFDLLLPSVSGRWETLSSSNGTSSTNQAYRSVIITVPHGDVTTTPAPASEIVGSALSSIF